MHTVDNAIPPAVGQYFQPPSSISPCNDMPTGLGVAQVMEPKVPDPDPPEGILVQDEDKNVIELDRTASI